MTKSFITLLFIVGSIQLLAQDGIEIRRKGASTDISGTVIQETITSSSPKKVPLIVTNTTGADRQWRITRVVQVAPPSSWSDQVCWPPQCYPISNLDPFMTPNSLGTPAPTILNNDFMTTQGDTAELKPVIVHGGNGGTAKYMYYITDMTGSYVDSVGIEFSSSLSTSELIELPSLTISPNPSSAQLTIQAEKATNAQFDILNILGNTVLSARMTGLQTTVDVSRFTEGVYFLVFQPESSKSIRRKFTVKH